MGSVFGKLFMISTFGESHGRGIGVVIDGVIPGIPLNEEIVNKYLARRRPGQSAVTTQRQEKDTCQILSGVFEGITTGTPVAISIANSDQHSSDYDNIRDLCRPGHADMAYMQKYGRRDHRGGGRASGRETAARVAAGAVAAEMLKKYGISIKAWTESIGSVKAGKCNIDAIENNPVRCPDLETAVKMEAVIKKAAADGDSLGGVIAFQITGVPAGWGEPVFDRANAMLAHAFFSIGAVRGVEFGRGFDITLLRGSENNASPDGSGISGGITTGETITGRIAVKPTPSIAAEQLMQKTEGSTVKTAIHGRHDPCLCPRIVPVAEAMAAIVLADLMLQANARKGQ